jgi:putative membrane protein
MTFNLLAHGGTPHTWSDLRREWGLDPLVLLSLALAAWLYAQGVWRLWRASGVGHGIRRWEAGCYAGGWVALFVALVSPLHPWGRALFSVHMAQHEILMLIAAPLLVLGKPMAAYLTALPLEWARALARWGNSAAWQGVWRFISNAFVAWLIHAAALWAWHIPSWFQATLTSEFVHALQHLSFVLSALLFWWAVVHGHQRAMGYGLAVMYMLTTAMHSGLLGALLTFAGTVWYPAYSGTTNSWGLTPLEDQQLGGLIMWMPAGLVYVVAGLILFAAWLRESERRVLRREAQVASGGSGPLSPVLRGEG